MRTEYNINSLGSFNPNKSTDFTRGDTENTIRNRGIMTWDVREQTEYGTLRAYIAGGWNYTNGTDGLYTPRAFIQFAGFTLGRATSFYDFYATPWYSNTTNVWGSDTGGGGKTVWGYTAQLGNGLSASFALEDPLPAQKGILGNKYVAGPELPDLTANMHLDAAWGSAQIAGALHQVSAQGSVPAYHPDDKVGWAIGAGLKVNLPMLGKGDSFAIEGDYTEGAIGYAGSGLGSFSWCHGASCGFGTASDATYMGIGHDLELTTAWSVVAGMDHHWDAHWKTSLYGTYGKVSYSDAAKAYSGSADDWTFSQIGSRTVWSPVHNLDLSVDVMYINLGTARSSWGNDDQSVWQAILRAQRNFYP